MGLTSCGSDDLSTGANIENGYDNLNAERLGEALKNFGSEADMPPIQLRVLRMTARVANTQCEKNQNDLGYICRYTVTMINRNGDVLEPVPDVKARIWPVEAGWMMHEDET